MIDDYMTQMLNEISADFSATSAETGIDRLSPAVARALAEVPRHLFIDNRQHLGMAYQNAPQPIGQGQTISQPFIVALMTQVLDLSPNSVVLELGTGSGYQAAILSRLVQQVYTVEIIEELSTKAKRRFADLGYANIHCRRADGYLGWPQAGPYDGVIVTAAGKTIPPALIDQLKPGAKIVAPLGEQGALQHLYLGCKDQLGRLSKQRILPVRFVPLTRS